MKVLVTGGAGFIGSHLCRRLLSEGIEVVVLDNLSVGAKERVPKGCQFIKGDTRDFSLVKKTVKKVDVLYHLAANVTIRGSIDEFYEDADNNIMGTLSLLKACKSSKRIKKFIFSSSMAVYADSLKAIPIKENYEIKPISPYGIAKLASERYIFLACKQMGIESTVLRFFNTYGPGQTYTPYVGVITIFINRLLEGKEPLIFGDGEQKRDFVYVKDIAEACYQILRTKTDGEIFNVGTGVPTSVNQIAALLTERINPSIKTGYLEAHPGELRNSIANASKLKRVTGFKPAIRLEKKITEVIDFIKENKSGSKK